MSSNCPSSRGLQLIVGSHQIQTLYKVAPGTSFQLSTTSFGPVRVAISVSDDDGATVGVGVGVSVGVCVGPSVSVGVGVAVCVGVAVDVGVWVGVCDAVCVMVGVNVGVCVAVGVGVNDGVGVGVARQAERARLCRWAATSLFKWYKLAPADKHIWLPERSRTVRLARALRSVICPISPLLARCSAVTFSSASVEIPYQVESGSVLSQLALRVQLSPSVAL